MFETKSNSKDIKTDTQKQQYNLDKSNKRPNQSIAHRK